MCLFGIIKIDQWKTLSSKKKYSLVSRKVFSFYFGWKTLSENCEKYHIICWLYQILSSNFLLLYIFCFEYFFQFYSLEFIFYINLGPYFYNCYLLFSYYFLTEIFYLSNMVIIFLIATYFIWNNLWNGNYYYFNFFIFQIFYLLDLISIILIIIYFI